MTKYPRLFAAIFDPIWFVKHRITFQRNYGDLSKEDQRIILLTYASYYPFDKLPTGPNELLEIPNIRVFTELK